MEMGDFLAAYRAMIYAYRKSFGLKRPLCRSSKFSNRKKERTDFTGLEFRNGRAVGLRNHKHVAWSPGVDV